MEKGFLSITWEFSIILTVMDIQLYKKIFVLTCMSALPGCMQVCACWVPSGGFRTLELELELGLDMVASCHLDEELNSDPLEE